MRCLRCRDFLSDIARDRITDPFQEMRQSFDWNLEISSVLDVQAKIKLNWRNDWNPNNHKGFAID